MNSLHALDGAIGEQSQTRLAYSEEIAQDLLDQIRPYCKITLVKSDNRSCVWKTVDDTVYIKTFTDHMDGSGRYRRDLWGSLHNCFTKSNVILYDNKLRSIIFENKTENLVKAEKLLKHFSTKELTHVSKNFARGLATIHQQSFDTFGWLNSEKPECLGIYDDTRDFPLSSYEGRSYYEFEKLRMQRLTGLLGSNWISPDFMQFNSITERIDQEGFVRNNGDYNPWNVFIHADIGDVSQVIDWEWSISAPRGRDVANSMLYLILYSRWSRSLHENLNECLQDFLSEYEAYSSVADRNAFRKTLPFYFTAAALWNTWFHYYFEGKAKLATINMELANVFAKIDDFDITRCVSKINNTSLYS